MEGEDEKKTMMVEVDEGIPVVLNWTWVTSGCQSQNRFWSIRETLVAGVTG